MQNHHFSGAILHNLCISNGTFKTKLAFMLQFAALTREADGRRRVINLVTNVNTKFIIINGIKSIIKS